MCAFVLSHTLASLTDAHRWAFDPTASQPEMVKIHAGLSETDATGPCFNTHGMFMSNTSSRLYVIVHHGT